MPQYGQSPWSEAGEGIGNLGGSMARIALAQQMGRQKAQQFAQQQALEQAYLRIAQQKQQSDVPEVQARTGLLNAQTDVQKQNIGRTSQMDDLARAVAQNMYLKQVPGGMNQLMAGGDGPDMRGPQQIAQGISPTNVGPTQQNADAMNQGDLVRNAVQLIGMNNPAQLEQMMHGVNIPKGAVNVNELTGQRTEGMPQEISPYQNAMIQLGQDRLAQQGAMGNRRMDASDQMNLYKIQTLVSSLHKGLAEVYSKTGDLDKAQDELKQAESGTNEETSDADKPQGKPLDATTAKEYLRQANGDKDKARQLAKSAGYNF